MGASGITIVAWLVTSPAADFPVTSQTNFSPASADVTSTIARFVPAIRAGEVHSNDVVVVLDDQTPGSHVRREPEEALPVILAFSSLCGRARL